MGTIHFKNERYQFKESELELIRSGFVYKRIPFEDLESIVVKRGSPLKRPYLSVLFGFSLIFAAWSLLKFQTGAYYLILNGYMSWDDWGVIIEPLGGLLFIIILLIIMGLWAIVLACWPVWIAQIKLKDGNREVLSLTEIRKRGQFNAFLKFLHAKLP